MPAGRQAPPTADGMALLLLVTAIIVGARLTGYDPRPAPSVAAASAIGAAWATRHRGGRRTARPRLLCGGALELDAPPPGASRSARPRPAAGRSAEEHQEETLSAAGLRGFHRARLGDQQRHREPRDPRCRRGRCAQRPPIGAAPRVRSSSRPARAGEGNADVVSRSVSYVAAPAFAAALLEHQVLRTIAVGRHVLLIADIRVEPGADMAGQAVAELERDGQARVLALQVRGIQRLDWSPHHGYLLAPSDPGRPRSDSAGLHPLAGNRPVMSPLSLHDCRVMFRNKSAQVPGQGSAGRFTLASRHRGSPPGRAAGPQVLERRDGAV